jgi:hypothetical protein
LLAEMGCGALTAAILIGHTAGHERLRSDASFALLSGTAPIPCSSGKRTQHRLNRGGDRQLNHALHVIAITRAQRDPATKEYLARKEAEGKTSKGALRSLKRHLARHFHQLLAQPAADQQPAADGKPITEPELPAIPEPPLPAARSRSTDQERRALADGLHQLDRQDKSVRAVLRPAAARDDRSPPTSPATNRRNHREPSRNERPPTRSQPFCGSRSAARDR